MIEFLDEFDINNSVFEYVLMTLFREEYGKLFDFVNGKNLRIKNTGKVRNCEFSHLVTM